MKNKKPSIVDLAKRGEELLKQSQSAGQSVVGLQQHLNSFNERWENLSRNIADQSRSYEDTEMQKVFVEDAHKLTLQITEIIEFIEKITVQMNDNPKELLTILEVYKQFSMLERRTQMFGNIDGGERYH